MLDEIFIKHNGRNKTKLQNEKKVLFRKLERAEIRAKYPHEIQRNDKDRIFIMNTLFNLAETHLLASIIDFIDR